MATQHVLCSGIQREDKCRIAWSMSWIVVLFTGLSGTIQAATIQCPLPEAQRTITNSLPEGWWTTPIVDRLSNTRVANIGGKPALICQYGKSGTIQRSAPNGQTCRPLARGFKCSPGGATGTGACKAAVQDRVAWNYKGNKRWSSNNIARLCRGAKSSSEPARCFKRVMHGGINWGNGTRWKWKNAIELCAGSRNAASTISCFQQGIRVGKSWKEAAEFCSP